LSQYYKAISISFIYFPHSASHVQHGHKAMPKFLPLDATQNAHSTHKYLSYSKFLEFLEFILRVFKKSIAQR